MRRSRVSAAILGISCAFGARGAAGAADGTWWVAVPRDASTIQAAIESAPKDRTVVVHVAPGTYREAVLVSGFTNLTLEGEPGALIAPTVAEPAISVCSTQAAWVTGFSLTSPDAGLAVLGGGTVHARDLRITDCGTYGLQAAGVAAGTSNGLVLVNHYGHTEQLIDDSWLTLDLRDCTITTSTLDAVRLGDNVMLECANCTITAPGGDGIHAEDLGGHLVVENSTITDAGDDGVDSHGAGVTLDGGSIVDPVHDGVSVVSAPGMDSTVDRFTITGAGNAGIDASDVRIHVDASEVADCGADGILLGADATAWVNTTTVQGAGGDGIATRDGGVCEVIADCTVTGAAGDGIDATSAAVTGNVVSDVVGSGIVLSGDPGHVRGAPAAVGNQVVGTGGTGIASTIDGLAIGGNIVEDTGGDGIAVDANRSRVTDNSVTATVGDGIALSGRRVEAGGNDVSAASGDGLSVTGSSAFVHDNVIDTAAGSGIALGTSVGAVVTDNTVADCGDCGVRLDAGAKSNRLVRNVARNSRLFDLFEDDGRGANSIARSNVFATQRRRHHGPAR